MKRDFADRGKDLHAGLGLDGWGNPRRKGKTPPRSSRARERRAVEPAFRSSRRKISHFQVQMLPFEFRVFPRARPELDELQARLAHT